MEEIQSAIDRLVESDFSAESGFYSKHLSNCTLRDYQILGCDWLASKHISGHGGILADEMGLGKTLQTIAFLVGIYDTGRATGRSLIVCPLSVLQNWRDEFAKFAPQVKVALFIGDKEEREALRKRLRKGDDWRVLISTYELCLKDEDFFQKFKFDAIIVDEGHRLKNSKSQLHMALKALNTSSRFILTGTPIQNNITELFTLLHFVAPSVFKLRFRDKFISDVDEFEDSDAKMQSLYKILKPFLLRRVKEDVLKSLPKKVEVVLYHGLSALQKKYYRAVLAKNIEIFDTATGNKTRLLNVQMQLRKCINHPYLFDGVEPEPFQLGEHLVQASAKLLLIDQLLRYLQPIGHKVLLFSQMTRMLDILQDYLTFRGFTYERLDGSVRGEERYLAVKNFNQSEETFAFLLSTKAGGVGLNLVSADTVIFVDSDFNPQNDLQAAARVHRIGQKRNVKIIRLVGKHTIEEIVLKRAEAKLALTRQVIGHGKFALGFEQQQDKINSTADELRAIMKFGLSKLLDSIDDSDSGSDLDLERILGPTRSGQWVWTQPPSMLTKASTAATSAAAEEEEEEEDEEGLQHMYMFEGKDYSSAGASQPTDADEKQLQELVAALKPTTTTTVDEAGYTLRAAGGQQQQQQQQLPQRKPRRQLTEAEKEARRQRRLEAVELRRVAEEKRRAAQWRAAGYASCAVRDEEEGDEEEEEGEEEEADLHYSIGSATEPDAASVSNGSDKSACIVCASVDDSGSWGSGGMFAAIDAMCPGVARQYELAKSCNDMSLGDIHLIDTGRRSNSTVQILCALLICQNSSKRTRPIELQPLTTCLRRLRRIVAQRRSEGGACSVHLPRIGDSIDGVGWYAVERLLRKELARRGVAAYIYYFPRRHSVTRRRVSDDDEEEEEEVEEEVEDNSLKLPKVQLGEVFSGVRAHLLLGSLTPEQTRQLTRWIIALDGDLEERLVAGVTHVIGDKERRQLLPDELPDGCVALDAAWVAASVAAGRRCGEAGFLL